MVSQKKSINNRYKLGLAKLVNLKSLIKKKIHMRSEMYSQGDIIDLKCVFFACVVHFILGKKLKI